MFISDLNLPPFKKRDLHAVFPQGCVQKLSWRTFYHSMSLISADRHAMRDWIAGGGPWTFYLLPVLELPISQTYSRTSESLTMEGLLIPPTWFHFWSQGNFAQKQEIIQFSSVQSLTHVWLFATPWIATRQASLSQSSLPEFTQTPRVHSNSHPSSRWCHPAILSSVVPFSSCPQSLPASESFPMS